MMHVMQPVVMDTGWSSATNSPSSSRTADAGKAAVSASLSSSVVNSAVMVDSQPQNVSTATASFKTLNEADVSNVQPRSSDTSNCFTANQPVVKTPANPQKPPKKPLTPYMRFSKAVCCYMHFYHDFRLISVFLMLCTVPFCLV